jgi:hypothetical protein
VGEQVAADPANRQPREDQAILAESEGEALERLGDLRASRSAFESAAALYEPLVAEDAENAYLRAYLGHERMRAGEISLALGEVARAHAALEGALAVLEGEALAIRDGQLARARALAAIGEVARLRARSSPPAARRAALEEAAVWLRQADALRRELHAMEPPPPSQARRARAVAQSLREVEGELARPAGF